jgi:predicted chitinase
MVADEYAFESAMFFFDKNKLWDICDKGVNEDSMLKLTKRINGGTNGLEPQESFNNKVL